MKRDKDLPSQPGVYLIVSPDNEKGYAGSTSDLRRRANRHTRELRQGVHYNQELQQLHDQHNGNLEFIGLPLENKEQAVDFEQAILNDLGSSPVLCNIATDARDAGKSFKPSMEHKAKLIQANIGRPKSPEHRAAISATLTGRKLSPEAAEKARVAAVGSVRSEETRQKIREAQLGKVYNQETLQKFRLAKAFQIEIDGIVYNGYRHAEEHLGVSYQTVKRRVEDPNFPTWKKVD